MREINWAKQTLQRGDFKYIYATQFILFLAIIIRTAYLSIPMGIFPDEAISGYDSWCLANYGVDQHLSSYPVYLRSWGSGQSAMYAYLGAPFIKLFGLSTAVYRLPMALISCASLIMLYYTFRKTQKDYFYIFIAILFFAVNPWHIMKSRWALDCNLSPDFILIGACFFILGYHSILSDKKRLFYYLAGSAFLVFAAYSYGVSWFMLPLFSIGLSILLYKKKAINISQIGYCLATMVVLALPLILFALLTITKGEQYQLGPITITALKASRHGATTLIGDLDFWPTLSKYAKKGIHLFVFGDDTYRWNTFYLFGQFYNIFGLLFAAISLILLKKKKEYNIIDSIFLIWLLASLPIVMLVEPNVNHWNIIWFPLTYFVIRGVYFCVRSNKWLRYISLAFILLLFAGFARKYITFFSKEDPTYTIGFMTGLEKHFDFVKTKDFKEIYFTDVFVYPLFYNPVSPYEFATTKKLKDEYAPIEEMSSYSNYNFILPENINPKPNTAYIIRNDIMLTRNIELDKFHIEKGETFTLLWND